MAATSNEKIFSLIDLASLPKPDIVESPLYSEIKKELVTLFIGLVPGYKLLLESDPVAKVIEAWAYRELVLRERINQAAYANLLAKAGGGDLDQLGAFYGVARMLITAANNSVYPAIPATYETDSVYRYRIQTRIMGWANAGGIDHYKYWALSSSPQVKDVAVYSPIHDNGYNMGGRVIVTVLSTEGTGVPTQDLIDIVSDVVKGPSVKVVSDIVDVEPAVIRPMNITANIRLLPRTPKSVFDGLATSLRSAFTANQTLGWDVTQSWLIAQLQVAGVHSVSLTSPALDFVIPPNEFPSIDNLNLIFSGYSDTEQENIDALEEARLRRLMYDTYIEYAVANKRPASGIAQDLEFTEREGIIQPTTLGLAQHLGIDNFYAEDRQTLLTELEIATLIYNVISPRYVS